MMKNLSILLLAIGIQACASLPSTPTPRQTVKPLGQSAFSHLGKGRFDFKNWNGPSIPVWTYVPTGKDPGALPILIVMHGTKRDGDRYRDEWTEIAQDKGLIIIAPTFSKANFPKSTYYNLGGVFERKSRKQRDESTWAFSAIEPIFDEVVRALESNQTKYSIYGHSAGSQFVHRFLFYKPNARVEKYIPANAGWYTLADKQEAYPYGLLRAGVSEDELKIALQKNVIVLLGDKDTDANHEHLRRTPEAMRQGAHRFARGLTFFINAKEQAKELGVDFNWELGVVPGAIHSNAQMAVGAADLLAKD